MKILALLGLGISINMLALSLLQLYKVRRKKDFPIKFVMIKKDIEGKID